MRKTAFNDVSVTLARPFVKWAGGKAQLLDTFRDYYPRALQTGRVKRYIEPFVGGGAVLFDILQSYNVKEAFVFDINEDLINAYIVVKYCVNELIEILSFLEREYLRADEEERKHMYYDIRNLYNNANKQPGLNVERAAQFIFLNHTCFNGLYRVNKAGLFNVPAGRYKNPKIYDEENLYSVSNVLKKVSIFAADYKASLNYVDKDSFVYIDPPYRPLTATARFTSYSRYDFTDDDQIELAQVFREMNKMGALLMLSNSDPKNVDLNDSFFDELYKDFHIYRVYAKRSINAKADGRASISELIVTNYKVKRGVYEI